MTTSNDDHFGNREEMIARYRTLERDLTRLTAENEELRDRLEKMRDTLAVSSEDEERRLRTENEALRKVLKFVKPEIEELCQGPSTAKQRERRFECLIRIDAAIKEGS